MESLTEKEIENLALRLFGSNKEMRSSFILGTYYTIYTMKTKKK